MAQRQGSSSANGGRIDGSLGQAVASTAADFALGAGWGNTAEAVLATGSNDQRGTLTLTASGARYAQATATVVHTFADGAWASAPFAMVNVTSNSAIDEGHVVVTTTTTAATWTFSVLPVSTKIYIFRYLYIA